MGSKPCHKFQDANTISSPKSSQHHNPFSVLSGHHEEVLTTVVEDMFLHANKENIPPKRPRNPSQKMAEELYSAVGGQSKAKKPITRANVKSGSKESK